jgi:precorrin-4 methylase
MVFGRLGGFKLEQITKTLVVEPTAGLKVARTHRGDEKALSDQLATN